ncbi:hypothetical protein DPMN_180296 [Dreissena polymorpha]|uniref:Uncharacterized protein n=1 Tax=Dreissena polymorpha TaxID=45954 RepID=A0A9D4EDY8_DREPO|nr:hypothetical protein DPMN_180296 [Dreissena polymorpha]
MNLLNTVGSRDFGQACVLEIQCSNCGAIHNVATGRKGLRRFRHTAVSSHRIYCRKRVEGSSQCVTKLHCDETSITRTET